MTSKEPRRDAPGCRYCGKRVRWWQRYGGWRLSGDPVSRSHADVIWHRRCLYLSGGD